ncbi:MAG: hypothetical protein L6416_12975 [Candidatus Omnitrophica bacterium]|nr:hypothetical protein [Candidatus Omnitrophota bacterium]
MKKLSKNNNLVIVLVLQLLIFLLQADTSFADKLQFAGFNLENNPVNRQLGQSMKISGTISYFTKLEEPKPLSVMMTIAGEIDLPVEMMLADEKIINEETNNKMQEWSFSAVWDGDISFDTSSEGVYECLIEASTGSAEGLFIQKIIRVGVANP